jgi:hypothetical protein
MGIKAISVNRVLKGFMKSLRMKASMGVMSQFNVSGAPLDMLKLLMETVDLA